LQFPDVSAFADHLANQGKIVMVAALDGTFQKKVCISYKLHTSDYACMHTVTCMMHPHRFTGMPTHQQDRDWELQQTNKTLVYLVNYVISITVILADSVTVPINRMMPKIHRLC